MNNAYRIATNEEFKAYTCDEAYSLLVGPRGFKCLLTEPEDRNWHRDAMTSPYYPSGPLSYDWLLANGWRKLERGERQPTDHCRRAAGLETVDEHFLAAPEDLCIDVCPDRWPDTQFWHCWLTQAVSVNRQPHRWIHVRHLKTVRDLIVLYEGITGRRHGKPSWRRDELAPPIFDEETAAGDGKET